MAWARARANHSETTERVLHGGRSTLGRCGDNGEGTVASHSRNTLHTNPLIASKRLISAAAFRIQKWACEVTLRRLRWYWRAPAAAGELHRRAFYHTGTAAKVNDITWHNLCIKVHVLTETNTLRPDVCEVALHTARVSSQANCSLLL